MTPAIGLKSLPNFGIENVARWVSQVNSIASRYVGLVLKTLPKLRRCYTKSSLNGYVTITESVALSKVYRPIFKRFHVEFQDLS